MSGAWTARPPEPTLGVLGGMGPAATAYFFQRVIEATPASCDQDHLHVIVDSNAKIPDRTEAIARGELGSLLDALGSSAERLVAAGADLIAMPCNSAHVVYSELQAACPVEILDLVTASLEEVARLGFGRPALLATRGTIECGIYQRAFERTGLLLPGDEHAEAVHEQIGEIKAGRYASADAVFQRAVRDLRSRGADCVLLACTDIPLAIDQAGTALPLLDTCAILADVAVTRCLGAGRRRPAARRPSDALLAVGAAAGARGAPVDR